ncbi:MAG: hypothetical protein ACTSVG_04545, partial [Alphaproteobacteria bacterium]
MTGEKKDIFKLMRERLEESYTKVTGDYELTQREVEIARGRDEVAALVKEDNPDFHAGWQIACIMRRAAGLPYSDTPASVWREEGTPEILQYLLNIISLASESRPIFENPKSVLDDLYKLRHSLRALKRQLLSTGERAMELLNHYAEPFWQQKADKLNDEYTIDELYSDLEELEDMQDSPNYQTPIEAALEQMDRLEKGLTITLEQQEDFARAMKDMGQLRTYSAKMVAYGVGIYMYSVTGKIPGLRTGENPSGPYAKAVLEIFDILGIPP